jgi:hypothetical protein
MKYSSMTVFAFAVIALSSDAYGQEKKDEAKDVTAEVKKMVEGGKLLLGGKTSNRSVTLDDKMEITNATRKGKELVITVKVGGPKQKSTFTNVDGMMKASYDPDGKKGNGKTRDVSVKGNETFQVKGTLTITIPDEAALRRPAAPAAPATPEPKGKGQGRGKGKVNAKKGKGNNKA